MIFLIYTILLILQQYKGMTTVVTDPCQSNIPDSKIVANMCMSSSATEEENNGNYIIDSVILRIMIQQDNCICRVTIDKQINPIALGLGKYNDHIASAPKTARCGLAIDINHIPDTSTEKVTAPIECVENVGFRYIQLYENSTLQFKSRIIEGHFTKGYCMRIQRGNSDNSQVLRIDCDAPTTTEKTTENTMPSVQPQSSPQTTESVKSTTKSSSIYATSTAPTTDNSTTDIYTLPSGQPQSSPQTTESVKSTTKSSSIYATSTAPTTDNSTTGLDQTTYIAIGAGSGVALILLVVLVVACLRKSTQKAGTNGNVNKSYQQEDSDDKLPNNVLYVPATEFDITGGNYSTADVDTARSSNERLSMEGNYSTVDEDTVASSNKRLSMEGDYSTVDEDIPTITNNRKSMGGDYSTVELDEHLDANCNYPANSELGQTKGKQKPAIKPKPKAPCINSEENRSSDQSIKHITPPNGSDSFYAVVDKSSNSVPTANIGKEEATCQPDQTYAVVDKARKRNSNPDETNKKKFEINYDNKV